MFIARPVPDNPLRRSGTFLYCAPTERGSKSYRRSYKHLAPTEPRKLGQPKRRRRFALPAHFMHVRSAKLQVLSYAHGSKQVFYEAVDVTKPNLVELDRGFTVLSRIFMGRNFGDPIAALQALHHHLLLNGGDVFLEIERANDLSANGTKTVLALGAVLFPSHVNADA